MRPAADTSPCVGAWRRDASLRFHQQSQSYTARLNPGPGDEGIVAVVLAHVNGHGVACVDAQAHTIAGSDDELGLLRISALQRQDASALRALA